jgi:hypothetical protein
VTRKKRLDAGLSSAGPFSFSFCGKTLLVTREGAELVGRVFGHRKDGVYCSMTSAQRMAVPPGSREWVFDRTVMPTDAVMQRTLDAEEKYFFGFRLPLSPGTTVDLVDSWDPAGKEARRAASDSLFPHSCPACGSPAYLGFMTAQCTRAGCPAR